MKSASENESQIAVSFAGMHNDEIFSWWNLSRKECRNRLDLFISWYNEQKNHCIGVDLVDKEGFYQFRLRLSQHWIGPLLLSHLVVG